MVGSVVVQNKVYGNIITYPDEKSMIGDLFFVVGKYQNRNLAGVIDKDGNEVIQLDDMKLISCFCTKDNNDYCLSFKRNNSDYLDFYHIRKDDNNKTRVVCYVTDAFKTTLIEIVNNRDNYLVFKNDDQEEAVYSIKKNRLITDFLSKVEFTDEGESNYHTIFFEKDIFIDVIDTLSYATTLCGFMDSDGNFSSDIVDLGPTFEKEMTVYNSISFGGSTLDKKFFEKIIAIKNSYQQKYAIHESNIDIMVKSLFDNPNIKSNVKTNIIDFNTRKKV